MSSLISLFKKNKEKSDIDSKEKSTFKTIEEEDSLNDKFFCCPKCNQRILISLNPLDFSLSYSCKNNHTESNINYNNFYNNKKYINHSPEILCKECKTEKLNHNNILTCNSCQFQLCVNCIIKHKFIYSHTNFAIIDNNINKCPKHNIDISQYCKTCKENLCVFCLKKNDNKNKHNNHEILNFSELILDVEEIEKNKKKLEEKILKNNSLINKLNNWKKEMCSLINDVISNLNSEIMIYKIIIQNFNWKFLEYTNYFNYKNAIENLKITNEKLDNFLDSKMFIDQTTTLTNYLFGNNNYNNDYKDKKNIFSFININNNEKKENLKNSNLNININNENTDINNNINNAENLKNDNEVEEEAKINIVELLSKENALLCSKNIFYSYSLNNNEIKKLIEYKSENPNNIKIDNSSSFKFNIDNNKIIYNNLINLINSINFGEYNILIWKMEIDLKKDKLFNLINNENKENIFKNKNEEDSKKINIKEEYKENENENKEYKNNIFNFNFSNTYNEDNNNENNISQESSRNLLFTNNNTLYNNISNYNNNSNNLFSNSILSTTHQNTYNNNQNNNYSNIFGLNPFNNNNRVETEKKEEYVYISATGHKYHGRPQCGRMKSSSKLTISRAEALGLTPCMRCY